MTKTAMLSRPTISALLLACALLAPASALAAPQDAAAADALFRAGRKAMDAGDFAQACPKFAESLRLDPAVGTLFNLANCEEKIGKLGDASAHFHAVLEQLPPRDDRGPNAKAHLAAMEPRLSRLTLVLAPAAPEGLAVARDGLVLGDAAIGVALVVNAGDHQVTVTAPGHVERRLHVTIKEGERRELVLRAGPSLTEPDEPTVSVDHDSTGTRRTIGFVVGGVGIASLGVGVITGALTLGKASVVKDPAHCDAALRCDAAGVDAAQAGKTLSVVSTVTIVTGAAAVAAGVVLVLTARGGAPVTAGVQVSPGGAGLQIARAW